MTLPLADRFAERLLVRSPLQDRHRAEHRLILRRQLSGSELLRLRRIPAKRAEAGYTEAMRRNGFSKVSGAKAACGRTTKTCQELNEFSFSRVRKRTSADVRSVSLLHRADFFQDRHSQPKSLHGYTEPESPEV